MIFEESKIKGLWTITPELKTDNRGYFTRVFAKEELKKYDLDFNIIHINRSFNNQKGIIRGMHFQQEPHAETKIVQCLKGKIFDVAIDLREDSSTFGKWNSLELSEENKKMLYIPKGFAHGFQTLSETTEIQYLMSYQYISSSATGVRWDDPAFKINWPITNPILLDKDNQWPLMSL